MAQKRMFDKKITESDRFIDLPNSTKALYFMAGMSADDRGFFQPKKLQRECGFTDDDYKILIAKNFFIAFDSGVMVVTDWNKNNWLDSRRLTETEYIDELNMLKLINNKYELGVDTLSAKPVLSENSIVENSIEENSSSKPAADEVMSFYLNNINSAITPYEAEVIEKYQKELPNDLIIYAMQKAVEQRARKISYIDSILSSWISKGITTLAEAKEERKPKESVEGNRVHNSYEDIDFEKYYANLR